MKYETLILEEREGVYVLTLNRPDRLNALNEKMASELCDVFRYFDGEKGCRCVIVTGAGRAFCSGADIRERFLDRIERGVKREELLRTFPERLLPLMVGMRKPIIAAINGPAVGFGFTFTLACDIRIASEDARISLPFVRMGLMPEFGSTFLLPRLIGMGKACELVFTGKMIDAREAFEMGLVNKVVPPEKLMEEAMNMAEEIRDNAPLSIQFSKRALYRGLFSSLESQLEYEGAVLEILRNTEDHKEAVRAFLEKRKPNFKGE